MLTSSIVADATTSAGTVGNESTKISLERLQVLDQCSLLTVG
jgi:hypothetical protein